MDASRPRLTKDALNCIEVTARGLIGRCGLTRADLDDLISELTLDLIEHLPRHDARRSAFGTFVRVVVTGKSKRILRDLCRRKRTDEREAESLDAPAGTDEDGNEISLGDTLDADDTAILQGGRTRSRHEEAVLRLDVTAVLSRLPRGLQECCAGFMEGRSVSELARESGLSRSAFRDCVIAPLRQVFGDAGYGKVTHEPQKKSRNSRQLGARR